MNNPVVSRYGHSYSWLEIEKWLKTSSKCPSTRLKLTKEHLVKNYAIADALDAFRAYQTAQENPA